MSNYVFFRNITYNDVAFKQKPTIKYFNDPIDTALDLIQIQEMLKGPKCLFSWNFFQNHFSSIFFNYLCPD